MGEIDKWIDIAKQCKYLPENDLKVCAIHGDFVSFFITFVLENFFRFTKIGIHLKMKCIPPIFKNAIFS